MILWIGEILHQLEWLKAFFWDEATAYENWCSILLAHSIMMHPCKAVVLTHKNWLFFLRCSRCPVSPLVLSNGFPNLKSYVKCGGTGAKLEGGAEVKMQCIGMLLGCPIMNSTCSHTFLATWFWVMCATPTSVAYSPTYFMMMNHFPATLNYPQSRHIKTIRNLGLVLDPFWAIYGEVSSIRGEDVLLGHSHGC